MELILTVGAVLAALDDDYVAVRFTAEMALRREEGYAALGFTASDAPASTRARRGALMGEWFIQHPQGAAERSSALALTAGGVAEATVARLRARQDRTPLTILE
jgi:hypothetical protein